MRGLSLKRAIYCAVPAILGVEHSAQAVIAVFDEAWQVSDPNGIGIHIGVWQTTTDPDYDKDYFSTIQLIVDMTDDAANGEQWGSSRWLRSRYLGGGNRESGVISVVV
jgi:hypothetical protein